MFSRLFFQLSFSLLIAGVFYSPGVIGKSWLEDAIKKGATEKLCKKQKYSIKRSLKALRTFCKEDSRTWKSEALCFRDEISFLLREFGDDRGGRPRDDNDRKEREDSIEDLSCVGVNVYGKWAQGGGCNIYGCWYRGGGCNVYGCWSKKGSCNVHGCIKEAIETEKACTD